MRVLLDTNIMLRATQQADPQYAVARKCIADLLSQGFEPCLVPQVLYEYWVVATRPVADNGLGMSTSDAAQHVARLKSLFRVLRDERGILELWESLVTAFDVQGKSAHDARLVAAMQRHTLQYLCTFNISDFRRYPGITVIVPATP